MEDRKISCIHILITILKYSFRFIPEKFQIFPKPSKKDPTVAPRFARFARNVWGVDGKDDMELAKAGIQKLYDFFKSAGITMTLKELNIDDQYFRPMAEDAVRFFGLQEAYVPLTPDDVVNIFKACLA